MFARRATLSELDNRKKTGSVLDNFLDNHNKAHLSEAG